MRGRTTNEFAYNYKIEISGGKKKKENKTHAPYD